MSASTTKQIISLLSTIKVPSGDDIVNLGMVKDSSITLNDNGITIVIDQNGRPMQEAMQIKKQSEALLKQETNFTNVQCIITAERPDPRKIPNVKHIILIASGKGGVGKSTTAVNLAVALQDQGLNIGIVDLDIYGPSLPQMLNSQGIRPEVNNNNRLAPIIRNGLQTISIGNLVDQDKAVVWRGSMVSKAVYQLLFETAWDNLDYLVVDMPPGTGDIPLSLCKNIAVDGAILVTTPQEVALIDVKKAADMFTKLGVPIIGIVENMSHFKPEKNAKPYYLFGKDGGKKLAKTYNIPFLGEIPIEPEIAKTGDKGKPQLFDAFTKIAQKLS